MRIQKFLIFSLFVGSNLSPAFSQTPSSNDKASLSRIELNPYQKALEEGSERAEAKAKEADGVAAAARQNLDELHRSAVTMERQTFDQKQFEIKARIARAEANATTARAQVARSRNESIKDQARIAMASVAPGPNQKEQSKQAQWLQRLVPQSEQQLVEAEAKAAMQMQLATEAEQRAKFLTLDVKGAEARQAALIAKLADEEARNKATNEKKNKAFEAKAAKKAQASLEPVEIKLAKNSAVENEKAREQEAASKAKSDKEMAKNALNAEKAVQKTKMEDVVRKENVEAEKAQTVEEAAAAQREQEATKKAEARRLAQKQAEQAKAIEAQTKAKEVERQTSLNAVADRSQKAKSEDFFRAKKVEPTKLAAAPVAPVEPVKNTVAPTASEERLVELLRKKQSELDAQQPTSVSKPTPAPKIAPAPMAAPTPMPAPAPAVTPRMPVSKSAAVQPSKDSVAEDKLVEILRKKQTELDMKQPAASTTRSSEKNGTKTEPTKKHKVADQSGAKEREDSAERIQRIEAEIKMKEEALRKNGGAKVTPPVQSSVSVSPTKVEAPTKTSPPARVVDGGTKEARLAELLRRYKADEITPHEYHLQRAKIVAEP